MTNVANNSVKPLNAKTLTNEEFFYGHKACGGCGGSLAVRLAMKVLGERTFAALPAGCMSAVGFIYPQMAFRNNAIITPFAATGAVLSGIRAGIKALGLKDCNVVGFAGDGGTADIGMQALSGAIDRNENIIYICYDNEAYMNTGIQRSSATPFAADTKTAPVGRVRKGKKQYPKKLTEIIIAHDVAYAAQASPSHWRDLNKKVEKALTIEGPAFMNILAPCPPGWRFATDAGLDMAKLAVETCFWPLYEYENGKRKLTYKPKEKLPLSEWTKHQGRFRHLHLEENKLLLEQAQKEVDRRWNELLYLCGEAV